ncbi:MAG TPA: FAD-binding oxidoreductase [Gaiellaceae bacterium]|nr:FAD-binding oxidoreductase [Gaiellaceae bacterium]
MSVVETPTLESLAAQLRGELVTPQHPDYESARSVWNGMVDRRPAAIVRALGTVDVVAAVSYARETGTELAVRGGGHSSPGFSTSEGGLVLDLSRMKGIWVDPVARTARAQAGALWGDLDRETQAHSLAVPGGQISHTGIAGLTLGGGIGWLSRKHGLTIDSLVSVDVVTADGRLVTASADEHAELFWGLRGGSGNFGVVVSFEYRLHPVGPLVLGGPIVYALDAAAAVIRNARDVLADAPDDVAVWLVLTHVPPQPPFPEQHWGETVLVVAPFSADLERGPGLLEPLTGFGTPLMSLHGPLPYTALQSALDGGVPHGNRYWERGDNLAALTDGAIDALVASAREMTSPRHEILFFPLGGAIARVVPDATAFGDRTAQWVVWTVAQWTDAAEDDVHRGWARGVSAALAPFASGGVYVNAIGEPDEKRKVAAYGGAEKLERLRALKREWDPDNLFRLNHNITP